MRSFKLLLLLAMAALSVGCTRVTATRLSPGGFFEPNGIPYYLPKPYLVVSKNVRYIPSPTIGLTAPVPIPNSFDSSFKELTLNITQVPAGTRPDTTNQTNILAVNAVDPSRDGEPGVPEIIPSGTIQDGLVPHTFYTYQFVYLPDLTQKYGLRVAGGLGEFRSTMNLVNGWMYTGMGPTYMRDSSTAASIAAVGTAVSGVIDSAARLKTVRGKTKGENNVSLLGGNLESGLKLANATLSEYAVLYVFEPVLCNKNGQERVVWKKLTQSDWPLKFNREYFKQLPSK